jgi:archaemetzincin
VRLCLLVFLFVLGAPKKPDVPAPGDFWKRLPPVPGKGDWRADYPEEGQTFKEYKEAHPTRPTAERTRIYLQPWLTRPPSDPGLLQKIAKLLKASFGREVTRLENGPLPARAHDRKRRQFAVMKLGARLVRTLPDDALFLLAVTDRDLFMERFEYAFGWGSFEWRVGVMSTHRADVGEGAERRLRRVLSLALHESTHELSLPHCIFYHCLMNGARDRDATDKRPMQLCPVCRSKVCWNLGLEPMKRYVALAEACREVGLPREAARMQAAAEATQKRPSR